MIPVTQFEWTYLADTVMGGVSQGSAVLEDNVLRLAGQVSTANNGGFIQARTELPEGLAPDVSAIVLRVRGRAGSYAVHLRTTGARRPWEHYRADLPVTADWSDVVLPLAAFAPTRDTLPLRATPGDIRSLGVVASGADFAADVSVSAVGFMTSDR